MTSNARARIGLALAAALSFVAPAKAADAQVIAARELAAKTLGEDTRDLVFIPITPSLWA